jgi:hypothetical protein
VAKSALITRFLEFIFIINNYNNLSQNINLK